MAAHVVRPAPSPAREPGPIVRRRSGAWGIALVLPRALALALAFITGVLMPRLDAADTLSSSAILQELRSLREAATVLYVAAHPDDENTRLIAWLARGRGYRTGYLSVTRGDGGQNLIGSELREALGVIRTQELLAARRIDGGEQFFTRAVDFGYSKSPDETLALWDRAAVLLDMVRVFRTFRPDVVVTRFSPEPSNTHGHHTASAMLALEAFQLAGDATAYREELPGLAPWQPKRIAWNAFRWGAQANAPLPAGAIRLDAGGYNPLLGESYAEIAARSRSMHKSQGFGSVGSRGPAMEDFLLLAGEPWSTDLMDGIDTSWARFPGGAAVAKQIDDVIAMFDAQDPARSVPALLALRRSFRALPAEALVQARQHRLDHVIQACLGLYVETTVPRAEVVPGETVTFKHSVILRAGEVPVRWEAVRYPAAAASTITPGASLQVNQPDARESVVVLPPTLPLTQPYWLRQDGTVGLFAVEDATLIGRADNRPVFPVEHEFTIAGETLVLHDDPVQVIDDPVQGELRHPLAVVPPVTLSFGDQLALFAPGATRTVAVTISGTRPSLAGTIRLEAPAGWKIQPAQHTFGDEPSGNGRHVTFEVTAPAQPATAHLTAVAEVNGVRCDRTQLEIHYEHIPPQMLQPPARLKAVALDVAVRARSVGYLHGAGDLVAESLARIGCDVTLLQGADLVPDRLRSFDAIVLGVRAFNKRDDLVRHLPALFGYVEAGGTLLVQYNTTADLKTTTLAPYPLRLSRDRVTDENSTVTLLAPEHPALNLPNKITAADFAGWVQERGLYFPNEWDARFTPLLGMHDPGEAPTSGALLVAAHGQGWFVYTGLSFFRELPEGVPGAYRLLANLVSLGK